jgi:AraC family transcriptional regulator, regulatory protein of adaptative response / methylated-DNA-[protein]-cysteine methyltransferase
MRRVLKRSKKLARKTRKDESRWRAVQLRDRRADGAFVYAVRSTGIYCRPSCPSRKPARDRVVFFTVPAAAEQEGFRACRRCRPDSAPARDPRIATVAMICRQIDAQILADASSSESPDRYNENNNDGENNAGLTLVALSAQVGVSPYQLERAFRHVMGITPRQYADAQRMRRLKSNLKEGDNVTTALYEAGFSSASRLYERAPEHLGMTPATYCRGGAGMQIQYAIADSPLGRLLVAATERGISALYIGENDAKLIAELREEYPRASLSRDDTFSNAPRSGSATANGERGRDGLSDWIATILKHLRGKEPHLDLPTDVQATAFQRRVWEELRKIPYGTTRTYTQVARAVGKPAAIRAVARACATNPVSVVVPCHRVVRQDGALAGYRWGIERKRGLLENESANARKDLRKES